MFHEEMVENWTKVASDARVSVQFGRSPLAPCILEQLEMIIHAAQYS